MRPFNEQFTLRGIIIGIVGCVIITASSVYLALKLGALPWPIFFVVLLSLFSLKALARKSRPTNINEANVSATVMTAGAMVAGGLAFTIPGIYMLMPDAEVSVWTIMLCALCGVALGCIGTALFRKHFIEDPHLPYVIGTGAAETLEAGDAGGRKAVVLFSGLGVSGLLALVRDAFGALPSLLTGGVTIPGVTFGVYCSPMALAMGFMIGPIAALVWFIGGMIGDFGIVVGGSATELWDIATGQGIKMSLGIGIMIGCGIGIVVKVIASKTKKWFSPKPIQRRAVRETTRDNEKPARVRSMGSSEGLRDGSSSTIIRVRWVPLVVAVVALVMCLLLGWSLTVTLLVVVMVWIVMLMAAQCTGQAGMNPMEIFGLIVLLVIALICQIGGVQAFLVAATATVCCGFVGDLMNDFKAGHILKTNPRAQWYGEVIGGIIGAIIGAVVIALLVAAYGPESFGVDKTFVAAQATAVSMLVGGIPSLPAFLIGAAIGFVLYLFNAPVITLGLGVYLPFYLSLTIGVGALIRVIVSRIAPRWANSEDPIVLASGLLAGESIVGICFALFVVVGGLLGTG